MALTDTAVRNAKPRETPYKLWDERGLFLLVAPAGGKWWRLKYRFEGKEKLLSLGTYPDVGLKDARERRDSARKLRASGVDPSAHRKAHRVAQAGRAADSFEAISREWYAKQRPTWAPAHADRVIRLLERDLFPYLGGRPVSAVTSRELLAALRRMEERGALETAHRALRTCGAVFRYAIATQRAENDPTGALRGALPPVRETHRAAITDPKRLGPFLAMLDAYEGLPVTRCALRLAPLVFVRPGELRKAEWAEIDLERGEWSIPGSKMKMGESHLVPLCRQALEILRELLPITGRGKYVFPGARSATRPMSDVALLAALRRMGIGKEEVTVHGFRATARTLLAEELHVPAELIEHQLAHAVKDPNGRAYNRTSFLPERRAMMQQWADYLDSLAEAARKPEGRLS